MTPDLFFKNRLSKKGPRRSGVKCGRGYIKRSKHIRTIGIATSSLLVLLTALAIFPIASHNDSAEATFVPATTTLSIVSSKNTASVDVTPVSSTGTFATSSADNMAEFTVTTDNLTGYSVTLLGSDASGQLVNDTTGDTLDSITADTTESDFRTGSASTYNNKWGYRLNINNTTTTNFLSAPTSTTVAKTIYSTTEPNTTGTSDSFTLGLGARIDYTKPTGTYTNTFIITAIANNISYQINYLDSDTTTTLLPSDAESNISASSIELNSTTPSKSGYEFKGWCDGKLSTDGTSCTADSTTGAPGTIYQPGDTYTFTSISATSTNTANLYAVWEESAPTMQNLSLSQCTTTPMTVKDSRDNQEYVIQKLADGNCWMMTNLNLGATALTTDLTSANTNLSTTITAATFNGWKKSTGSQTYTAGEYIPVSGTDSTSQTPYGTLYNDCAASAGTICTSSNSSDAQYDICPKGWRLPTGGSSGEFQTLHSNASYNTYAKMRAPYTSGGAAFALAGRFYNAAPVNQGSYGTYWSSTLGSNTNMYSLNFDTSSVYPANNNPRYVGRSIRCVLQPTMQNFTTQEAESMATGETKTLADSRDNQTYTVAKLADGNVWMTRNLAIGCNGTGSTYGSGYSAKTLTSADSNVSANYTTSTTTLAGKADSYDNDYITCSSNYGGYYNYAAASASTITSSSNTDTQVYDVCPKGWRLPTQTEANGILSYATQFNANVGGGNYYGGNIRLQNYAYWWASTAANATNRAFLYYTTSLGVDTFDRGSGFSIRCIKDTSDIPDMQNISAAELNALVPNTGDIATLKDSRDGEKYKVSRLADGNVWLLENLRLDISDPSVQANLTSATTNATDTVLGYLKNGGGTSPYPASGVSTSWAISYNLPYINTTYKDIVQSASNSAPAGKIGIYYNFCAASAGSYCYISNASSGDANQDICPAGWRLPTGGASGEYQALYTAYSSNVANLQAALSTPLSGYYDTLAIDRGGHGYFWSSIRYNNTQMWSLTNSGNDLAPQDYTNGVRSYGFSVRCLAK